MCIVRDVPVDYHARTKKRKFNAPLIWQSQSRSEWAQVVQAVRIELPEASRQGEASCSCSKNPGWPVRALPCGRGVWRIDIARQDGDVGVKWRRVLSIECPANDARSPLYVATPACTTCMLGCLPSIIDRTGSRLRHLLPSLYFLFYPFFFFPPSSL